MRQQILNYSNNAKELESLYRSNKRNFQKSLTEINTEQDTELLKFWRIRLFYQEKESPAKTPAKTKEPIVIIGLCILVAVLVKIPDFSDIDADEFYSKNIGFVIFPALTIYFYYKNQLNDKLAVIFSSVFVLSAIYINALPDWGSDSSDLAYIHLPLLFWSVLGISFIAPDFRNPDKRKSFLEFNGNLLIMTTIILITGILMTLLTLALFTVIDFNINEFYFQYIVVIGMACSPVVGTYLAMNLNISKIAPIIARIFSPLLLVTLIVYLAFIVIGGKDPYSDREFLLTFNLMLIGVLSLILFSIIEYDDINRNRFNEVVLLLLAYCALIIDLIAISAIIYRMTDEFGLTPNRLAVLGGNILFFVHLLRMAIDLTKLVGIKQKTETVKDHMVAYLPVYTIWSIIVVFLFPVIFGFR